MSYKIKNLNIKAFRGISCLNIPFDSKSLILVGENGTGKSSIVNALEYFFTENVSPLKGTRAISFEKHGHNVNFNKNDLKVSITFDSNQKAYRNIEDGLSCNDNELKDYINNIAKSKFILRRRELLNLVESIPSERHERIISLIGLGELDKIEENLNKTKKEFNKEYNELKNKINNNYNIISNYLNLDENNLRDVLIKLNIKFKNNNLKEIDSLNDLDEINKILRNNNEIHNEIDFLDNLIQEIKDLNKNFKELDLDNKINEINNLIAKISKLGLDNSLNQYNFFSSAQKIIRNNDKCPLCKQDINLDDLNNLINENLDLLNDIKKLNKNIKELSSNLKLDLFNIINILESLEIELKNNEKYSSYSNKISSFNISLTKLINQLENIESGNINPININHDFNLKELNDILENLEKIKSKIELDDNNKKLIEISEMIFKIENSTQEIQELNNKLKISKSNLNKAEILYNTFKTTKNKEVKAIFEYIKKDLHEFYNFLHPNELHKDIELSLEEEFKNSVFLKINSFDIENEDPRAYASEGHLDTLGLCIFLAFIKEFNQDIPYIILDDVVTTVDASHREKIAKLILKEFPDKQLIITTHDKLWFKQMSQMLGPFEVQDNFLKSELIKKDSDDDIQIIGVKGKWPTILEKLENNDEVCAGNLSRQYYEEVLDNICRNIHAPLPLKDQGYTVHDYRMAINSRKKSVFKAIKSEEFKDEFELAFKKLDASIIGNLLSHNNPMALNISIEEVETFAHAVHNLKEVFSCDNCNRYLRYTSSSEMLMCSKPCKHPTRYFKEI
ncbi:AAA family ATPase [Methanobrevibacter sp. OttesenSCG-928-K11]|nr:AAA family ATPase [Methanobrevibacter sp. OttesenSCG-928-K11]